MDCQMAAQSDGATSAPIPDTGTDRVRSGVWLLLATLLRAPPDGALLDHLCRGIEPSESDDRLAAAWDGLQRAAGEASPPAVEAEFHDLFIGLGRGELVPYASWYRTGFLMDRPLVALRGDLAALGLLRRDGNQEPEDHAAALAETMALLADPESGRDRLTQSQLFHEHVDSWMPTFCSDLQKADKAAFYRAVGGLGEAYLEFERHVLDEAWPPENPLATAGSPSHRD